LARAAGGNLVISVSIQPPPRGEFRRALAGGFDGRANADGNGAGALDEGIPRPHFAGVVRHRHDGCAGFRRQPGAADAVTAFLAGRDAGALGKYSTQKP